ncbi:hypothetical protein ACQUSR_02040 [Streptomyces sp. P1-3]|uniref:hypothetical protein n=1 Tax=Streptomyces sp. P1-3 TaxID=3421658 RepID=UPI003D363E3A
MSGLPVRGINYDVGTAYVPGTLSRPEWDAAHAGEDLRVIAEELHCTAVCVFGTDIGRLSEAAELALERGLEVWIQPRFAETGRARTLAHLEELSVAAENLRRRNPGKVTLSVGCELSIFMPGVVPGGRFPIRSVVLTVTWPLLLWVYNRRLNSHLRAAVTLARQHFHGPVSYGAGSWEGVDWTPFDLVGVNLYRDAGNHARYTAELATLRGYGKPVVITEFGCCTYTGADAKGANGDGIVNWRAARPKVKPGYTRNEQVQADYLAELLHLFDAENVHGAFVFEFAEPMYPHSPDPRHDLDMASYGIARTDPADPYAWEPKAAFHRLAGIYGRTG